MQLVKYKMIQSKKGIESFPFFLFLTLFIAAFVITVSFYQIQALSSFSSQKSLSDTYTGLINTMETLRATSDKGSFTSVKLEVPSGYTLNISAADNTITIKNGKELVNRIGFNILNITDKNGDLMQNLVLDSGKYEIVVYYGETTNQTEPYEIFFT
jgi:hypothetical protein